MPVPGQRSGLPGRTAPAGPDASGEARKAERHLLTIAVEDYFQVSAFSGRIEPSRWRRFEGRVEQNTLRALDLLDRHGARATFFALGWVADEFPEIIREIVRRGHEVASKGYFHRPLREMAPAEFRADALRSRESLEKASGRRIYGYRVAQGTVGLDELWALDILADLGFAYDSSIYPMLRSIAAQPWRRFAHQHHHDGRTLWEFPLSTFDAGGGVLLPCAGGNAFRQAPHALMVAAVERWERSCAAPFTMYFHVWELDPDLPRIALAGPLTRVRQYRNLECMPERIADYLQRFRFTSVVDHLGLEVQPAPETPPAEAPARVILLRAPVLAPGADPRVPLTIVVPCYNEADGLGYLSRTLDEVVSELAEDYAVRFLFVDDGSSDRTWDALHRHFGDRADCGFVRHEQNRGVAAAILTGIREAETEIVASIDADCTYDPRQLSRLVPMLEDGVDLVTASPYHPDGKVLNVPAWRLALSRTLSGMYRRVLHHDLATYTSCFRVYRRSAVADLNVIEPGFLGVAETLGRLDLAGARIRECPAVLEARVLGRSHMKVVKTIVGHLGLLGRLVVERWRGNASPLHRQEKMP